MSQDRSVYAVSPKIKIATSAPFVPHDDLNAIRIRRLKAEHERQCAYFAPYAMAAMRRGQESRRKRLAAQKPNAAV